MRTLVKALFLGLVLHAQPAPAAMEAGLRAVYDVTRTKENPAAETGPKSKVENVVLTVRMTPAVLALREDDTERIFDFAGGRVTILDHAKQSAYEFSLYAEPAFRELELKNRAMLTSMMAALGQAGDLVDAESELGMLGEPPAKLRMKEQRRGEERVFVLNKQEAVTFAPAAMDLPPGLSLALDRLYLVEAQVHPQVRAALARDARLPARLVYGFRQFGSRTTIAWQLRQAAAEELDMAAAGTLYPPGPIRDDPVLQAAWRLRRGEAGSLPSPADYDARIERLLAEGRGFEGFLVGMEAAFAIHHTPGPQLRRARQVAGSDPRMDTFLHGMQIDSAEGDAREALALLESFDASALEGGPAIHVQRANQYVRLGNGQKALEEFGAALAINPFLFGPLHDAGWIYYNGYAMPMAWACWDAARALLPGSPSMRDVADLEAALRRKHPEFF